MPQNKNVPLIIASFLTIYIVWGSTYVFVAYVVEELPPFFCSSVRYIFAAIVLFILTYFFKSKSTPNLIEIRNSIIAGTMMLGIGAGLTSWVLQYLDSGFTALLISAQPLIIVFLMWLDTNKKPSNQVFLGILLGILGIYLLVSQNEIVADKSQWLAILVLVVCLMTWGVGSIFISKAKLPASFLVNTGIQIAAGALVTLCFSLLFDDLSSITMEAFSRDVIWALLYLSIFGSVIAFLAFNYLLRNVSPDKVSTGTYINPIIAIILGWWFRDELITSQSIAAATLMLTGVLLINFKRTTIKKSLYHVLVKRVKPK